MKRRASFLFAVLVAAFTLPARAAEEAEEAGEVEEAAAEPATAHAKVDETYERLRREGQELLDKVTATVTQARERAQAAAKKAATVTKDTPKAEREAIVREAAKLSGEAADLYEKASGESRTAGAKYEELVKHLGDPEQARFAALRRDESAVQATLAEANALFFRASVQRDAGKYKEAAETYGQAVEKLKPLATEIEYTSKETGKSGKAPHDVSEEVFLLLRAEVLVNAMDLKKEEESKRAAALQEIKDNEKEIAEYRTEAEVTFGDQTYKVKTPRTAGEVLGGDKEFKDLYRVAPPEAESDLTYIHYDEWTLAPKDFTFEPPFTISFGNLAGPDKFFFVVPFAIRNSTDKRREIAPLFRIRTSDGWSRIETGAYLPHRALQERTLREYLWTHEFYEVPGLAEAFERRIHGVREPAKPGFFEPGEVKHGVAVFRRLDPNMDAMSLVVEGLASDHMLDRGMSKALLLPFVRKGDEFNVDLQKVNFKRVVGTELLDPKPGYLPNRDRDALRGYDWVWLWAWERDLTLEAPQRTEIERPGTKEMRAYWHYEIRLSNRMETEEIRRRRPDDAPVPTHPFELKRVNTLLPLEVLGHRVVVRFPDDGLTDIYRTRLAEQLGLGTRATKRFITEDVRMGTPKRPSTKTGLVVFAEDGYDIADVVQQIEDQMALGARLKAGSAESREKAAHLAGCVRLTETQHKQLREELAEKVPVALAEAMKVQVPGETRRLAAEFTVEAALASAKDVLVLSYWPRQVKLPEDIRTGQ